MAGFEDLAADVLARLNAGTEDELLKVAEVLERPGGDVSKAKSKGRAGLLRMLMRYLGSEEVEELEDQGKAVWGKVTEVLVGKVGNVQGKGVEQDSADVKETLQPTQSVTAAQPDDVAPSIPISNVAFRKEFRIVGQIGEPQQKDKLSFSSLARQIDSGIRKKYAEEEVVEQVIRAISPGLRIRSYLEGRAGLDLPTLRKILRAHYREKDATALFHELSTAAQGPRETEHDFILRSMDLKQKVLFACQEAGSGVRYNEHQVQKMFLHAVSTGLQNDTIRHELKPYLTETGSDEEVLVALTTIVGHEIERQNKLKTKTRPIGINEISASGEQPTPPLENPKKKAANNEVSKMPDWNEMQAAIRSIVINEMKNLASQHPPSSTQGRSSSTNQGRPRRGCEACTKRGQEGSCRHCFRCGGSGHYARGCQPQGNANGVPQWDQERPSQPRPENQQ